MQIIVNCNPPKRTHQQQIRFAKGRVYKTQEGNSSLYGLFANKAPKTPYSKAISVDVLWAYEYRKTEPKKNRIADIACTTRPDCDNLAKGFLDILTDLRYWTDDGIIYELRFKKVWSNNPRIELTINGE